MYENYNNAGGSCCSNGNCSITSPTSISAYDNIPATNFDQNVMNQPIETINEGDRRIGFGWGRPMGWGRPIGWNRPFIGGWGVPFILGTATGAALSPGWNQPWTNTLYY